MARLTTCPDCGLQVSKTAPACPSCGRVLKRQPRQYGCCGGIILIALIGFVGLMILGTLSPHPPRPPAPTGPPPPPAPSRPVAHVGDRAVLDRPGGIIVTLAVDDAAWDEMLDAQNADSRELMDRLVQQGRVIREANGNTVLVVKQGIFSVFVQVVDGIHNGAEGWVQSEFVRPLTTDEPKK
jgi:hypothetical protein